MSIDHEEWLRKQGAKVVGRHQLRKASLPRFSFSEDPIEWAPLSTSTIDVFQVELSEQTIEKFERNENIIARAHEFSTRTNRFSQPYFGSGPNDISDFLISNRERHYELLKENEMYREAWKEFQAIRVLLGETPYLI